EGEYPFLNLIECLAGGEVHKIRHINGLAYRNDGSAFRTQDAEPICNLDQLPIPARYFSYQHVSLTRGCAARCHFCGSPQFWGRQVRFHSADYFVEQLYRLYKQGIRFFYVSDDTFTINANRVVEICKKIIQSKMDIHWSAISRVDMVKADILYWMRKAGCIQISYGVESGSEKIRRVLGKKISNEQILQAFELTQKHGIMARAYFIYGCPGESWQTIEQTLDLIEKIKPLSAVFYILDLFPGTSLYDDYKRRHGSSDDVWLKRVEDIMYFESDPSLSRDLVLAFGEKLRNHFYEKLPEFVESLELIDDKHLYPQHSDFFSRLALTFEKGDYSSIAAITAKDRIAEKLYHRSLSYGPNARAFLGLGMLFQHRRDYHESIQILLTGIEKFPYDEQLQICLALSYMNLGKYQQALSYLLKLEHLKEGVYFIVKCYQALNDSRNAERYLSKYDRFGKTA
ncbi:MAG: radical SAM protein, partial [Desulfobacterales bacterium]|nr:radical SAM protein [Desulfobacterales bacterium]